ncbi:MFS general substrate transporter [Eremomyces bilateralis CBS 781.70]|uniref:MFS general substrate transporter n=1 Tax=Eremomyces bilateralis CBS 781.70 TaxID=1392243 RepID=A0A6G1G0R0_9PEZI|nr:MFS general substrate transporter [Eremomyces bilateralis CBS 781.70]KAF1811623.1 MFS general substrate transporter [Eremomyces bilateralis CBS 781.70]
MARSTIIFLYHELGLASLKQTGRDAWLIILARCCRMFAYGTNALILALFLSSLNFSDSRIGLFMTLTLLGDVVLATLLTLVADGLGRRRTMLAGSVMMILSGIVFALSENFWLLLLAAVFGVISVAGGDFGPFRSIEESILSQLTSSKTRPEVLSWYVTMASFGSSIGTEAAGRIVDALQKQKDWTIVDSYHGIFWVYSAMGAVNLVLVALLSSNCELIAIATPTEESEVLLESGEQDAREEPTPKTRTRSGWLNLAAISSISSRTLSIILKLWFLLAIDALADGMTPISLTTYFMDAKFDVSKATLGDITSIGYFLAVASTIFAGPLSRRIGLINTMVFTHLPSSVAVLLFPVPTNLTMTVILLFVRMGLNNMDQAPRSAFIAAVVAPEERTAVIGLTSTIRTLASAVGPTLTGILAGHSRFWIAFVVAGALRVAYDLGLFVMFVNLKPERPNTTELANTERFSEDPSSVSDDESGDSFAANRSNGSTEESRATTAVK